MDEIERIASALAGLAEAATEKKEACSKIAYEYDTRYFCRDEIKAEDKARAALKEALDSYVDGRIRAALDEKGGG